MSSSDDGGAPSQPLEGAATEVELGHDFLGEVALHVGRAMGGTSGPTWRPWRDSVVHLTTRFRGRTFQEHGRCQGEEFDDVLRARCYPTRAVAIEREQVNDLRAGERR
jgi:hypothetical protein